MQKKEKNKQIDSPNSSFVYIQDEQETDQSIKFSYDLYGEQTSQKKKQLQDNKSILDNFNNSFTLDKQNYQFKFLKNPNFKPKFYLKTEDKKNQDKTPLLSIQNRYKLSFHQTRQKPSESQYVSGKLIQEKITKQTLSNHQKKNNQTSKDQRYLQFKDLNKTDVQSKFQNFFGKTIKFKFKNNNTNQSSFMKNLFNTNIKNDQNPYLLNKSLISDKKQSKEKQHFQHKFKEFNISFKKNQINN